MCSSDLISWYLTEYFDHIPILHLVLCKLDWNMDVFEGKGCWSVFILVQFGCHLVPDLVSLKSFCKVDPDGAVISYSYRISGIDRCFVYISALHGPYTWRNSIHKPYNITIIVSVAKKFKSHMIKNGIQNDVVNQDKMSLNVFIFKQHIHA